MSTLTVYFEDPFWVGVFEEIDEGRLTVSRVVFGAEPRDYEVWAFILKSYAGLRFSPAVQAQSRPSPENPKRRARAVRRELLQHGIGTRSQQALAAQREELKQEHRRQSRLQRDEEKQRQFDLKRQKRREKHRGR